MCVPFDSASLFQYKLYRTLTCIWCKELAALYKIHKNQNNPMSMNRKMDK